MAGSPAPPPPLKSNSSAPAFKSNASGSSPGHELAQGSSTSPAAAALPVPVPSDALVAVLGVVGELRARGLLAGFEIPEAGLTDEGAPALFDGVLTAFHTELMGDPAAASCLPIPPPPLGDGRKVELVSLFLAVRARGGFSTVTSWAAVAEAVGLDPTADDTAVKLLYGKYLAPLEQSCDNTLEDHAVVSSGNAADRLLDSKKAKFLSPSPAKHLTSAGAGSAAHVKRKTDTLVGMLDWVRLVATNPGKGAIIGRNPAPAAGHRQAAVELRRQMFAGKDCLAREELVEMLNWVRHVATSAGQPGIIGMDNPPDHLSTAVELRSQMSVAGMLNWVRLAATSPAEPGLMEGSSLGYRSTALLFRAQRFADKKHSSWSAPAASPRVIICCFIPTFILNASFMPDDSVLVFITRLNFFLFVGL